MQEKVGRDAKMASQYGVVERVIDQIWM